MKRLLTFLAVLVLGITWAGAATYYIDWSTGSDSNNGTTKGTPWKTCPGMQDNASHGSGHSPTAGDHYIFKGGVRWPSAALELWTVGGSSGNYTYYGVDHTWFTNGTSWTRPVFDAENTAVWGLIHLPTVQYVYIDGLEIKNGYFPNNDQSAYIFGGSSGNIIISNVFLHCWNRHTGQGVFDDGNYGIGIWTPAGRTTVIDSRIDNFDGNTRNSPPVNGLDGTPLYGGGNLLGMSDVIRCELAFSSQASHQPGSQYFVSNYVHDINWCTDIWPGPNGTIYSHPNVVYPAALNDGRSGGAAITVIAYNRFERCLAVTGMIYGSNTRPTYIFNNIFGECSPSRLNGDTDGKAAIFPCGENGAPGWFYVFNNTIYDNLSHRLFAVDGAFPLYTAGRTIVNNHGIPACNFDANSHVSDLTGEVSHNLSQPLSSANSDGCVAPYWRPTRADAQAVDYGKTLSTIFSDDFTGASRPQGIAWDAGAFEYGGTPPPGTAPVIDVNPSDTSVIVSNGCSFTVSAHGTAPLSYYWFFDGNSIANATNSTYLIAIAQTNNAGDYFAIVSNEFGLATSTVATLVVYPQSTNNGVDRFVTTTGSGTSADGRSWETAWSPSQISWSSVPDGATIWFGGGDYGNNPLTITSGGIRTNPIVMASSYEAGHDGNVIFDFAGDGDSGPLAGITINANYVTIDGGTNKSIWVKNLIDTSSSQGGAYAVSSSYNGITCRNLTISNCNTGIRLNGTGEVAAYNNLKAIRGKAAIYFDTSGGWDSNLIYSNNIEVYVWNGDNAYGADQIHLKNGVSVFNNSHLVTFVDTYMDRQLHSDVWECIGVSNRIYNNDVINIGDSCFDYDCYVDQNPRDIWIFNNVVRIMEYPGQRGQVWFRLYEDSTTNHLHTTLLARFKIFNNTLVDIDSDTRTMWIGKDINNDFTYTVPSADNEFKNNIFYNCSSNIGSTWDQLIHISSNINSAAFSFANNVYYSPVGPRYIYYNARHTSPVTTGSWKATDEPTASTNRVMFANYSIHSTNSDYHLDPSDTVARTHGAVLTNLWLYDKDWVLRTNTTAWDIGAYAIGTPQTNAPPSIQQDLLGDTNYFIRGAVLTVTANGFPAPQYYWNQGTTNRAFTSANSYTVTNLNWIGTNWVCIASNYYSLSGHTATSSVVSVLVTNPVYIVVQPQSTNCVTNTMAVFRCVAKVTGGQSPGYAWFKGSTSNNVNTPISSAYNTNYTIANVAATNAGYYRCRVRDNALVFDSYSSVAQLTVVSNIPPSNVTVSPSSQEIKNTNTADNVMYYGPFTNLTLTHVDGPGPFTYQWRRLGTNITGATSTSYRPSLTNGTIYTLVVSNTSGSSTSGNAQVLIGVEQLSKTESEFLSETGLRPAARQIGISP